MVILTTITANTTNSNIYTKYNVYNTHISRKKPEYMFNLYIVYTSTSDYIYTTQITSLHHHLINTSLGFISQGLNKCCIGIFIKVFMFMTFCV